MKIGDEYGENIGTSTGFRELKTPVLITLFSRAAEQIQTQQSNIGLMSALLLTLQFSFMYGFPGSWSALIQTSYFAQQMTPDQLNGLHEV